MTQIEANKILTERLKKTDPDILTPARYNKYINPDHFPLGRGYFVILPETKIGDQLNDAVYLVKKFSGFKTVYVKFMNLADVLFLKHLILKTERGIGNEVY